MTFTPQRLNRKTTTNIFAKWRIQCFYDRLVQGSSFVFQKNISAGNPPLRKAENREAALWPVSFILLFKIEYLLLALVS